MEVATYGGHDVQFTLAALKEATQKFNKDFKGHLETLVEALNGVENEEHIKISIKHVNSIYEVAGVDW